MAGPNPLRRLRARMAYKAFTGASPTGEYMARLDDKPVAAYKLGSLVGVAYEATRDGETERYFHEFAKRARPDLAVRDDGRQLYVVGDKYRVTDRGIEDMPAILIANPSVRPSRRKSSPKRKVAMAASRRRMPRRNAKGNFVKTSYKTNPRPRRSAKRKSRTTVMVTQRNPIRRRRHHAAGAVARRRFRRNPTGGNLNVFGLVLPAIGIGAGAVGSELAMGYLPIPDNFKKGVTRHITKGVVSLAIGWGIAKFFNRKLGEMFALGGLTIAAHDAIKQGIVSVMPSAQFGAYLPRARNVPTLGYMSPGMATGMGSGRASDGYGSGRSSDGYGQYMGQYINGGGSPAFGV